MSAPCRAQVPEPNRPEGGVHAFLREIRRLADDVEAVRHGSPLNATDRCRVEEYRRRVDESFETLVVFVHQGRLSVEEIRSAVVLLRELGNELGAPLSTLAEAPHT